MQKIGCPYSYLQDHKKIVFLIAIGLCVLAIYKILTLRIDNSSLVFIPDSDAELRAATRLFSKSPLTNLLFVDIEGEDPQYAARIIESAVPSELALSVNPDTATLTPQDIIRALPLFFSEELERKANQFIDRARIEQVMTDNRRFLQGFGGIAGIEWLRADPLRLRELLLERMPVDASPASGDGRHALVMFSPAQSAFDTKSARELIQIVKNAAPGSYAVLLAGAPVHTAANATAVENDLGRIIIFSLAGFILAYVLLARSWGAAWILLTAAAATMAGVAASAACWTIVPGIALGFGVSLMGLAEDYAVHMHFALRSGNEQKLIYCSLLPPLFQSCLLNSSGFAILLLSALPVARQMAFFALVSLGTGFILAIAVLPFLRSFTMPRDISDRHIEAGQSPSLIRAISLCLLLAAVCGFLYLHTDFNFSPRVLGASASEIEKATERIKAIWGLESQKNILIEGKDRDDALTKSALLANELRKAGAEKVISPSDFAVSSHEEAENRERWEKWLRENHLREKLQASSRQNGFGDTAFEPFYKALAMEPQPLPLPMHIFLFSNIAAISSDSIPERLDIHRWPGVHIFSPQVLENKISDSFMAERSLIGISIIVSFSLLLLMLRKAARVCAVAIPPLFSLVCIFGIFMLFDMNFNLAALLAIPIVFGLALDHGIMITHSLREHKEYGVRKAIVLASITAFMGIGLLALSEHPSLRSMGMVIFAGLAGELLAALWIVPLVYPKNQINY